MDDANTAFGATFIVDGKSRRFTVARKASQPNPGFYDSDTTQRENGIGATYTVSGIKTKLSVARDGSFHGVQMSSYGDTSDAMTYTVNPLLEQRISLNAESIDLLPHDRDDEDSTFIECRGEKDEKGKCRYVSIAIILVVIAGMCAAAYYYFLYTKSLTVAASSTTAESDSTQTKARAFSAKQHFSGLSASQWQSNSVLNDDILRTTLASTMGISRNNITISSIADSHDALASRSIINRAITPAIYAVYIVVVSATSNCTRLQIELEQSVNCGNFTKTLHHYATIYNSTLLASDLVMSDGVEVSQPFTIDTTASPSLSPTLSTTIPISIPTIAPKTTPSLTPTALPSIIPSALPSTAPSTPTTPTPTTPTTAQPSMTLNATTAAPTPTETPSNMPTATTAPSAGPSAKPSNPSCAPTFKPTKAPTVSPTNKPSRTPTRQPSAKPTYQPTFEASPFNTSYPHLLTCSDGKTGSSTAATSAPTTGPTKQPSRAPSNPPTWKPTAVSEFIQLDWQQISFLYRFDYPYDVPLCSRYGYNSTLNLHQFYVRKNDSSFSSTSTTLPRTEMRIYHDFNTGKHRITGYFQTKCGSSGVNLVQVFGSNATIGSSTTLQLRAVNDTLFAYSIKWIYGAICDKFHYFNITVDCDDSIVYVDIDRKRVTTWPILGRDNKYFKIGAYTDDKASNEMTSYFKDVKVWQYSM